MGKAYNAQAAVDSAHQVIVAADVTNQPSDKGQAMPLMEQGRDNTGGLPGEVSADAGYFPAKMVTEMTELGVEAFIPPRKVRPHSSSGAGTPGSYPQRPFADRADAPETEDAAG